MSKMKKEELVKRFEELSRKLEAAKSLFMQAAYEGEMAAIADILRDAAEKES